MFHQDLLSSLGIWAEGEQRLQQAVCYRVGMRPGLGAGEIKFAGEEREDLKLAYLLCWAMYFPGRLDL